MTGPREVGGGLGRSQQEARTVVSTGALVFLGRRPFLDIAKGRGCDAQHHRRPARATGRPALLSGEPHDGVAHSGAGRRRNRAACPGLAALAFPRSVSTARPSTSCLSMPTGTDARVLRPAPREFANAELANHRYVMVLHTPHTNPHVRISVRAQGRDGKRLNPRKEGLHRWRETFAEKLRNWGIEAEASSQATRGVSRRSLRGWGARPVLRPESTRSEVSTSPGRRFGARVPARCRPGPRSPRRWPHRPIRPTASSARASSPS